MLKRFALLTALSLADAVLTAAEAAHTGVAPVAIEANPAAAWALQWGLAGLVLFKLLPLALLGVLLYRHPIVPRALAGLLAVYVALACYHGVLWCAV